MVPIEFDIHAASKKLNELELDLELEGVTVEILWARAMSGFGEYVKERHMHSSYEFHYVPAGVSCIKLDNGEFMVGPGSFYITAPGEYHEIQYYPDMTHAEYSINCDFVLKSGTEADETILGILEQKTCCPYQDCYGLIDLFNRALGEAFEGKYGSYGVIRALMTEILLLTARVVAESSALEYLSGNARKKGNDYVFEMINTFIEDNMGNSITPGNIAAFAFLSEKQVNRIVRRNTGMPTMEYIADLKFKRARRALRDTQLSISQISDMLGFSSEYYFSQFFKQREGRAPSVYRKGVNPL